MNTIHSNPNVFDGQMCIDGPNLEIESQCEEILRSLPQWFGIEDALLMYVRDSARQPTFATIEDDRAIGFLSLWEHFDQSWEVHCMAVHASYRGKGYGKALLERAEGWLIKKDARFLQVKTIAATSPDPAYAETRAFYTHMGFTPLEVFPALWHPQNPCLQMVKVLGD